MGETRLDQRLQLLKQWLTRTLGHDRYDVRPASADASFRRYFRISYDGESVIAMDAPPEKEDVRPFIGVATRLGQLGLNVPHILQQDLAQGFLLITDLGDRTYLDALNGATVERMYGDALSALVILQAGIFQDSEFLPEYSHELLMREMELFREWYVARHLGAALDAKAQQVLTDAFESLARAALAQSTVWVHRDYHSRNLMLTGRNNPGILDFQDAVRGPITYDLVSLLRDCYVAWPRAQVEDWVKGYHELALQSGLPVCEDDQQFLEWFDRMGIQRHLKAIGIFARLNHRDNKPGYLNDIPRTVGYVLEVSHRYADLAPLHALLSELTSGVEPA